MADPRVCHHGGLRRQCEACDLAERLALAERLLRELVTLVRGESPQLLNEDSGGDGLLSLAIDKALS